MVYNHQIYERGKDFMSLVFMDKNTSRWLLKNNEDVFLRGTKNSLLRLEKGMLTIRNPMLLGII